MPYRAIIFDLFDTLVDLMTEEVPLRQHRERKLPTSVWSLYDQVAARSDIGFDAFIRAMGEADRSFRRSHYAEGRELPSAERFRGVLELIGLDAPDLVESLVETHMASIRSHVRYLEHHADVLASLKRAGRLIALCSNFSHTPTALRVLEESGLRGQVDVLTISDAVGFRKPREEIFRAVLRDLDLSPAEVVHVGDSLSADVAGAAAIGIRSVWITRRVDEPESVLASYSGRPPDWRIEDLSELAPLLDRAEA